MSNTESINSVANSILQIALKVKTPYCSSRIVTETIGYNKTAQISLAYKKLEDLYLIHYANNSTDVFNLTDEGEKAAKDGFEVYLKKIADRLEEAESRRLEKEDLELKELRFNYKWKWLIIASFIVALAGLVISIIAL